MATGMMLSGQGPVVDRSPGWLWGQGPVVNRSPQMMIMRWPGIRSLRRGTCWSRMVRRISTMPGSGAGASWRRRWSGPLSTLMAPGRVTSSRLGPGQFMTSGWSPMMTSMTTLITVWTMAIGPPSPRWAVGPGGSIRHQRARWHSLAGLLVGSLGRGGWFVLSCRVVLLPGQPVILSLDGWSLKSVLMWVQFNGVVHGIVRPLRGRHRLTLLLLFESLVKRRPHFREPISTHVTGRFSGT